MNLYKGQFLLPDGTYLLSHSVGCLPVATRKEQERFFAHWQHKGGEAWDDWLSLVDGFRHSLARLLNGHPHEFCPQANVSAAVSKILASLPPRKGRHKILISELDFPSIGFALRQAERMGYQVELLRAENGRFPLEHWQEHLTGDIQLALITHSLYGNSFLNPVADILQWAKAREILTIVDIAQSAGVVAIDLRDWNADFVVGSCIKWLCGGPGAGFLWANAAGVDRFMPMDVGWFSHENPFEFDIEHFSYATGARRFWGGTPSVLPYGVARTGVDLINEIGLEVVRAHNQALTGRLVQLALTHDLALLTPSEPDGRGGTICIGFPDPENVYQRLKQEGIFVDFRPAFGVRFSPHIYNDEADIDKVIACVESMKGWI